MKKHFKILLILLFFSQMSFGQDFKCRIDTIIEYKFERLSNNKNLNQRIIKTYDSNDTLVEEITQYWKADLNDWRTANKTVWDYDLDYKLMYRVHTVWNSQLNDWQNSIRWVYVHKENQIEEVLQEWYHYSDFWENSRLKVWKFDPWRKLIEEKRMIWDSTSNSWRNFLKDNWTYNNDALISQKIHSIWSSDLSEWRVFDRVLFSYNSEKKPLKEIETIWNSNNSTWVNRNQTFYNYDLQGMLASKATQRWYNNTWNHDFTDSFINNFNRQLSEKRTLRFLVASKIWIVNRKETYEYNNFGHLIASELFRDRDQSDNEFLDRNRKEFQCALIELTTTLKFPISNSKIEIYPNPLTGEKIFLNNREFTGTFIISNIQGTVICDGYVNEGLIISENLTPGLYVLALIDESGNETKFKIVK